MSIFLRPSTSLETSTLDAGTTANVSSTSLPTTGSVSTTEAPPDATTHDTGLYKYNIVNPFEVF